MTLLPLDIQGITDKQKLTAMAYRFYQNAKWEPKVGDYYTITRDDNQLCRIVGESETMFWVKLSWPDGQVSVASEFEKEGFATKDFGLNRIFVPEWALTKVEDPGPTDFDNGHFLKNKQRWSKVKDTTIRENFETRHRDRGYNGLFNRGLSGCYDDDKLQVRWEEYYNGFRDAEDAV